MVVVWVRRSPLLWNGVVSVCNNSLTILIKLIVEGRFRRYMYLFIVLQVPLILIRVADESVRIRSKYLIGGAKNGKYRYAFATSLGRNNFSNLITQLDNCIVMAWIPFVEFVNL
jgi:hypothetical protein